jgi:hypothetical protein
MCIFKAGRKLSEMRECPWHSPIRRLGVKSRYAASPLGILLACAALATLNTWNLLKTCWLKKLVADLGCSKKIQPKEELLRGTRSCNNNDADVTLKLWYESGDALRCNPTLTHTIVFHAILKSHIVRFRGADCT